MLIAANENCQDGSFTIAIANNLHALILYNISTEYFVKKVKDHLLVENHAMEITGLCGNSKLNIFVTSSIDQTIKIWDALDNTLIREIALLGPAWCVGFLNSRGDILVGLDLEIAVIRVQDYLNFHLMRFIIDLEFDDDKLEYAMQFDPTLDFWELYRLALEESGADLNNWHIKQGATAETASNTSLASQHINKRIIGNLKSILEKEQSRSHDANEFENDTLSSQTSDIATVKPPEFDLMSSSSISADKFMELKSPLAPNDVKNLIDKAHLEKGAMINSMKLPKDSSRDGCLIEMIDSQSSIKRDTQNTAQILSKILQSSPKIKESIDMIQPQKAIALELKGVQPFDSNEIHLALPLNQCTLELHDQVKLSPFAKKEIAAPNYIFHSDAEQKQLEKRVRIYHSNIDSAIIKENSRGNQNSNGKTLEPKNVQLHHPPSTLKPGVKDALANRSFIMQLGEMSKELAARIIKTKAKMIRKNSINFERLPEQPILSKSISSLTASVAVSLESIVVLQEEKAHENLVEECLPSPIIEATIAMNEITSSAVTHFEEAISLHDFEDKILTPALSIVNLYITPVEVIQIIEPIEIPLPKAPPIEIEKPDATLTIYKPPVVKVAEVKKIPKPIIPFVAPKIKIAVAAKPIAKAPPLLPASILKKKSVTVQKKPVQRKPIAILKPVIQEKIAIPIKIVPAVSVYKQNAIAIIATPKSISDADQRTLHEKDTWNLIKEILEPQVSLQNAVSQSMIEKLRMEVYGLKSRNWSSDVRKGQKIDLTAIIEQLFHILSRGAWQERIEASNTIFHLYQTFTLDFADPLESIVNPLLGYMQDENAQVRTHICNLIPKFGLFSDATMIAVIQRLADKTPEVRTCAQNVLGEIGIGSKVQLYALMRQLNLVDVNEAFEAKYGSLAGSKAGWLDVLLARLNQSESDRLLHQKKVCLEWAEQVDPRLCQSEVAMS